MLFKVIPSSKFADGLQLDGRVISHVVIEIEAWGFITFAFPFVKNILVINNFASKVACESKSEDT